MKPTPRVRKCGKVKATLVPVYQRWPRYMAIPGYRSICYFGGPYIPWEASPGETIECYSGEWQTKTITPTPRVKR